MSWYRKKAKNSYIILSIVKIAGTFQDIRFKVVSIKTANIVKFVQLFLTDWSEVKIFKY